MLVSCTCSPKKLRLASRRRTASQVAGSAAAASSAARALTQNTAVVSSLPMPRKVLPRTLKTGTWNRKWLVSSTSGSAVAQCRISSVVVTWAPYRWTPTTVPPDCRASLLRIGSRDAVLPCEPGRQPTSPTVLLACQDLTQTVCNKAAQSWLICALYG